MHVSSENCLGTLKYFLHSCSYNKTIDFLLFTDLDIPCATGSNIKIVKKSLRDIEKLVFDKMGLVANITAPYKLCDFKPAYGLLFEDYTRGYDFWDQCDLDVIFGNIRNFVTKDMTSKFDFINVRHDYTIGCFFLVKNTSTMTRLFTLSKDYQKVFTTSDNWCFDECNWAYDALKVE